MFRECRERQLVMYMKDCLRTVILIQNLIHMLLHFVLIQTAGLLLMKDFSIMNMQRNFK